MKRLVFLFISILFITFAFAKTGVYAQDRVVQTDTPLGVEMPATPSSETTPRRVNYELAYPGMLPDNPFYILKVIRDGIVKMLINDPFKRAKFSLLNSDKRIFAGKLLLDKGKDVLALDTIEKSNNYFDDALVAIKTLKKQNPKSPDIEPFLQKMKASGQKHSEFLENMTPFVDKTVSARFVRQQARLENVRKTVESMLYKK